MYLKQDFHRSQQLLLKRRHLKKTQKVLEQASDKEGMSHRRLLFRDNHRLEDPGVAGNRLKEHSSQ